MTDRPLVMPARAKRPIGSPLPVLMSALAGFLAVLAMLSAKTLTTTAGGLGQTVAVVSHGGHTVLRTTASGRVIEAPAPASASVGVTPARVSSEEGRPGGFGND